MTEYGNRRPISIGLLRYADYEFPKVDMNETPTTIWDLIWKIAGGTGLVAGFGLTIRTLIRSVIPAIVSVREKEITAQNEYAKEFLLRIKDLEERIDRNDEECRAQLKEQRHEIHDWKGLVMALMGVIIMAGKEIPEHIQERLKELGQPPPPMSAPAK